jgi:hypothetical protein
VVCACVTDTLWLCAEKSEAFAVIPQPAFIEPVCASMPTPKSSPAKAEKLELLVEAVLLSARLCCTISREADIVTLGA